MVTREGGATRATLLRLRRRADRVASSTGLLRRKREALVRELLAIAAPAIEARGAIRDLASRACSALLPALADQGHDGLAMSSEQVPDFQIQVDTALVWGQTASRIVVAPAIRRLPRDRANPGGTTGAVAAPLADAFERLTAELLEAASRESMARRLGEALEHATRQVRTLEERVTPSLEFEVRRVSEQLAERSLEEQVRLRRFRRARRVTH